MNLEQADRSRDTVTLPNSSYTASAYTCDSFIHKLLCMHRPGNKHENFSNTYLTNNEKCPLTMRRWGKNRLCIKYDENDDHIIIAFSLSICNLVN